MIGVVELKVAVVAKVELVDLRTQATRTLVSSFGGNGTNGSDSWLATGLLDAPVVHASPPPRPPDLRTWALWFASALLVMLLVGGTALWGSRGRRA